MEALQKLNLKDVIFLDIETAREVEELELDTPLFDSWEYSKRKHTENGTDEELLQLYKDEAALYPEFARIVCITVGMVRGNTLHTKTYKGDERQLLLEFNNMLDVSTDRNAKTILCGHAIKGFDAPFIAKRCMVNGLKFNYLLDVFGKKPWDVDKQMIDTKDLWKGTAFSPSSLINIAVALGIPSPKSDISGADVGRVFYEDGDAGLSRIVRYCERDVLTTANVVRKLMYEPLLELKSGDEIKVDEFPTIINLANGGKFGKNEARELEGMLKALQPEELEPAFKILEAVAVKKSTKLKEKWVTDIKKKYVG